MNPEAVDEKLEELCQLLEDQARANYRQAIEGAEAEADYRAAVAVERLKVRDDAAATGKKLTNDDVDALVADRTADLLHKRLIAQAKHEAGRDALFATRARVDAMRTLAASHREAAKG